MLGAGIAAAAICLLASPSSLHARRQSPSQSRAGTRWSAKQSSSASVALPRPGYAIAPGDLLSVYVVAVPELSRSYRVSSSGRITLPMLSHPVTAQGLTPDELAETIGHALRQQGLISRPDVLVTVESSPTNSIAVAGSVVKPGVYPVFGPTTIVAVLSRAGGLSANAGSTAIVMRGPKAMQWLKTSGDRHQLFPPTRVVKVPVRHLLDTGDELQNLRLFPGDAVEVPRAGIVYVVGAVKRAGGFALTGEQNEITVLQAIALAGNVTHTAMLKDAVIIRRNSQPAAGREQIRVNLKEILSGKKPDRRLSPGDILFVPDSTGKRVLARALAAATGVVIYRAPL